MQEQDGKGLWGWLKRLFSGDDGSEKGRTLADEVSRQYEWDLDAGGKRRLHGELTLTFSKEDVAELRRRNPFRSYGIDQRSYERNIHDMFGFLLSKPRYMKNVQIVAEYIRMRIERARYSEFDMVQFALDFVQAPNITYRVDEECASIGHIAEYMRFPDETLYDKEGDCDCKSFLMAALFHELGYHVLVLISRELGHAAIGIACENNWLGQIARKEMRQVLLKYNGRRYLFCETTADGFKVGEIQRTTSIRDFESVVEIAAK